MKKIIALWKYKNDIFIKIKGNFFTRSYSFKKNKKDIYKLYKLEIFEKFIYIGSKESSEFILLIKNLIINKNNKPIILDNIKLNEEKIHHLVIFLAENLEDILKFEDFTIYFEENNILN